MKVDSIVLRNTSTRGRTHVLARASPCHRERAFHFSSFTNLMDGFIHRLVQSFQYRYLANFADRSGISCKLSFAGQHRFSPNYSHGILGIDIAQEALE